MSQSEFLEDVLSWSPEDCRDKYSTALPKLTNFIRSNDDMQKELDVLKLIFNNFIPCVPLNELEELCLLQIADKTAALFDSLLDKIPLLLESVQGLSESSTETKDALGTILQAAMDLLGCFEGCCSYLASVADNLELRQFQSLPVSALHVVRSSYTHCKESSNLYGDLMNLVSDQLTLLFRKTHSLQMAFISSVDKVHANPDCSDEEIQVINSVLVSLFEISQLATSLDVKISITMWKTISRWACQYKSQIQHVIQFDSMLTPLCTEMVSSLEYIMAQVPKNHEQQQNAVSPTEEKAFCRGIKILGFQMKVLVTLVGEFIHVLTSSVTSVIDLIFKIYRYSPPCLESRMYPEQFTAELVKHVTNGIPSLVTNLLPNSTLRSKLISQNADTDDSLARLIIVVMVMDGLHSATELTQNEWMCRSLASEPDNSSIMSAMFCLFNKCYIELRLPVMLPGVMCKGKPLRDVSLYEFVCTHSCAFVASLKPDKFPVLERCLLEQILGPSPFCSLLSLDMWSFLARYGSAELCRDHCLFAARLLVKPGINSSIQCCHLGMLTRNLFSFLAPQHQTEFVSLLPPAQHLDLYSVLPLSSLQPSAAQTVLEELVTACVKAVHCWLNLSNPKGTHFIQTLTSLECLSNVYCQQKLVQAYVSPQQQSTVLIKILQLWDTISSLSSQVWIDFPGLLQLPVAILHLTAFIIQQFDNQQILQVLTTSMKLLSSGSDEFKVNLCGLLGSLSNRTFTANTQQQQCLHSVSECFTSLLSDTNPVIHYKALQVFCDFAENTPHESVVPESLESLPTIQESVINFINKTPSEAPSLPDQQSSLSKQRDLLLQYQSLPPEQLYKVLQYCSSTCTAEPMAKKQKLDIVLEDSRDNLPDASKTVQFCIHELRKNVDMLEDLSKQGGLPAQHITEIKTVIHRLQILAKVNNTVQ